MSGRESRIKKAGERCGRRRERGVEGGGREVWKEEGARVGGRNE